MASQEQPPAIATQAVLTAAEEIPEGTPVVQGYDFNEKFDFDKMMESYRYSGFQASNLGAAMEEINRMLTWRLDQEEVEDDENDHFRDPEVRKATRCKIFLGFTSNLMSCGLREVIRFLCQHKLIDVLVTTAGGIEEDFVKCLGPTYMGDFTLPGSELRKKGINRIGNMLVPNSNYCKFEDWIMPILDEMLEEQKDPEKTIWTPSKMIKRLGEKINSPDSVYYWCAKNDIPVFCPALTDGSIGDMIYFHTYRNPGLIVDIAQDIRAMNSQAVFAKKSGIVILGGGLPKHHICNANMMRNGADFAVYVSTAQEFDGSDAGARPDEAVSWGKIKAEAKPVKVFSDATLVFPLIVHQTFLKEQQRRAAAGVKLSTN